MEPPTLWWQWIFFSQFQKRLVKLANWSGTFFLLCTTDYSWDRSLANLQSGCLGVCARALKRKYRHLIWGAANFPVSLRASDLIARPTIIDVTMWGNMNSQKLETDQLNLNNQMYPANLEQESLQAQKVKTWNGTQRAKQNIGCIKRGKLDWNVPS
jgi:hypothetical protein